MDLYDTDGTGKIDFNEFMKNAEANGIPMHLPAHAKGHANDRGACISVNPEGNPDLSKSNANT